MNHTINNTGAFPVTIAEAGRQLEDICATYFEKDKNGEYVIPINRQRPVMLMGPAGIGKTDIPKQVAEKLDIGYVSYSITHHTRQSALGLPKITTHTYNGSEVLTTEYTASEIITAVRDEIENSGKKNGILFIDEVNCVSETLAAPILQLFQNKTLGQSQIPEGWVLVTAGNPPEYNKSVKEFDAVTKDRIRVMNVVPDSKAWLEYADRKMLNPAVKAYISSDESKLYYFDADGGSIVTPRGWEELSITLDSYERKGFEVTGCLIHQFIGSEETAGEFFDYYSMVRNSISDEEIDKIVNGTAPDSIAKKLADSKMNVRFMLIECLKRRIANASEVSFDTSCRMLNNSADFIEKAFGKSTEIEVLMSKMLSDTRIVKAAIVAKNNRFGKYLDDVVNAEKTIMRKINKSFGKDKGKGAVNE